MNVLWLTRKGEDFCCAPRTRHEFEQAVAKITNSVFIGQGWEGYIPGESIMDSVNRVMPDVDWVIDRDNNLLEGKPQEVRVGHFISDLHAKWHYKVSTPQGHIDMLNRVGYKAIFMRYVSDVYREKLLPNAYWVPWSVSPDRHYRRQHAMYDAASMGNPSPAFYPLRKLMMEEMARIEDRYRTLWRTAPVGKTFERPKDDEYDRILGSTKIHIFDCSVYGYPLQKFFESMASGCLVMSTKPMGAESLGFLDGRTYIEVNEDNWKNNLHYYLMHQGEAKKIADRGMKMVRKYHTHGVRAEQFVRYLQDVIERDI